MKKNSVIRYVFLALFVCAISSIAIVHLFHSSKYQKANELIQAIENNDVAQVKKLLEDGVDPNQVNMAPLNYAFWEMSAKRPLAIACRTGNVEIIELLISYGAAAEHQENTGWSPLKETLFFSNPGDLQIIELLLAHGADPEREEPDNPAVFDAASLYPVPFGSDEYTTGYDEDMAKEITEIVKLLLGDNDIDIQARNGDTLLICAARRGNIHLVQYLIACGCSASVKNNSGQTAYDVALENGNTEIAGLLE